jgi:hypothetical protein
VLFESDLELFAPRSDPSLTLELDPLDLAIGPGVDPLDVFLGELAKLFGRRCSVSSALRVCSA